MTVSFQFAHSGTQTAKPFFSARPQAAICKVTISGLWTFNVDSEQTITGIFATSAGKPSLTLELDEMLVKR